MRKTLVILATVILVALVIPHGAAASSSFERVSTGIQSVNAAAAGEWGPWACEEDTVAASGSYYAREKTCLEQRQIYPYYIRVHSVTKCFGPNGVKVNCKAINGDTVGVGLYHKVAGVYELLIGTAAGDKDCTDCHENSHYSGWSCGLQVYEWFRGKADHIRVIFPNGVLSSYHTHYSGEGYTAGC
jgi:hypothetical protein